MAIWIVIRLRLDGGSKHGLMVGGTKANGARIEHMVKASFGTQMVTSTRATGRTTRLTVTGFTNTLMVLST